MMQQEKKNIKRRLEKRMRIFLPPCFSCFSLLVGRLGYLQLVQGRIRELAAGNRIRILPLQSPREMFDRQGRVLVANRLAPTVSVIPMDLQEQEDPLSVLERLGNCWALMSWSSFKTPLRRKKGAEGVSPF